MSQIVEGVCPPAFAAVREVFQHHLDAGEERGARFTFMVEGQVFVDLWGGWADKIQTRDFDELTLTPVFSSSKGVAAFMIARLVDQGKLSYDQTVASVWPEFAQAGKGEVTVGQALSHQAGLPGIPDQMDAADWFDWDLITARLAAMAPMWPPGTASGYHPGTFGFIAGEIFRRVDGRTMGVALREDIAEPFGLDLSMGLPDSELSRLAEVERPKRVPNFGEMNGNAPRRLPDQVGRPRRRPLAGRLAQGRVPLGQYPRHLRGPGPADGRPGQRRHARRRADAEARDHRRSQPRAHRRRRPGPALQGFLGRWLPAQPAQPFLRPQRRGLRPLRL
jgi:CubicO group peptidase (beta-lactamase class C family)